jgi:hypothetical protein
MDRVKDKASLFQCVSGCWLRGVFFYLQVNAPSSAQNVRQLLRSAIISVTICECTQVFYFAYVMHILWVFFWLAQWLRSLTRSKGTGCNFHSCQSKVRLLWRFRECKVHTPRLHVEVYSPLPYHQLWVWITNQNWLAFPMNFFSH